MKIIETGTVTSPKGFLGVGEHVGIKKEKKDLALIYSTVAAKAVGTFTQNVVKAAPVLWDKMIVENYDHARVIAINSGVANACTGQEGIENNEEFAKIVADNFSINKEEVLICSTGVIGKQLPMEVIKNGVEQVKPLLKEDGGMDVATAILTTDTKAKHLAVEIELGGKTVTIGACCKGSGMIHPNMATMLGFITTDCNISKTLLNKALKEIIPDTFNMISVDRDTSTNDTVLLLANGLANNPEINEENTDYQVFKEALYYVNEFLAKAIAGDGEGATKLLEVQVHGANSINQAKVIAKSVCTSPLVKTAIYGNDANWGRLLCAMGYSGEQFDPYNVDLKIASEFGILQLVAKGMATDYSEELATKILSSSEVKAIIDIHNGNYQATAWGCDLTYDYVKINADYRS
ncbi:bifunctional ornithine acetyltransferase/N-acetylglutamate synthase [Erysipelatoclostridium sp. An173]|uniref:bifunctional glutamate N-acetyltransferase/amino-acid acetyltransferase ArgJ n=1 Tax=Erysipelatoclostridium sp. An173 TaxID=1965571 RepID=UPI000B3A3DCC|nr:bifunctional glutamate N-acetyltransferase/amino-acid acetyltransferase ArgJ [Erysipelatoclostridium sp. An173]OUP78780.1 bifunctional ornithine acetyltransferase/N-acetylglutamate synthase [Erysipelatoclostridium sp. An173]